MPANEFVQNLPSAGDLEADDLLYVQRKVSGQWQDFQFRAGNLNAVDVLVHTAVYTEADLVGQNISMFTPAAGYAAIFLPGASIKFETPTPLGLSATIQIGSTADELNIVWTNAASPEYLSVTESAASLVQQSQATIEVDSNIAAITFTLTVKLPYVLIAV
jgi:hypothetical protein